MGAGGEGGGEVGFGDGRGKVFGHVEFVLEGEGEGADAEPGFNRVLRRKC